LLLLLQPEGTQLEYSTSVFIDLTRANSYSTSMNVSLPAAVVPGSEIVELTALGEYHSCENNSDDSNDDLCLWWEKLREIRIDSPCWIDSTGESSRYFSIRLLQNWTLYYRRV